MSVRWMRTAQVSNGKFPEAIAWAKEISAWAAKKHSTPKIDVWLDAFGAVGTLRWSMDYADLATFEKMQNAVLVDADYWRMIEQAAKAQLFIDGSMHDVICKSL